MAHWAWDLGATEESRLVQWVIFSHEPLEKEKVVEVVWCFGQYFARKPWVHVSMFRPPTYKLFWSGLRTEQTEQRQWCCPRSIIPQISGGTSLIHGCSTCYNLLEWNYLLLTSWRQVPPEVLESPTAYWASGHNGKSKSPLIIRNGRLGCNLRKSGMSNGEQ